MLLLAMGVSSSSYGVMFTMLDDFRNTFGIAESALGFIVGIGFFTSFLGQVSIAPLADRGRAHRLIILGLGLEVLGCLGMAFGTTFDFCVRLGIVGRSSDVSHAAIHGELSRLALARLPQNRGCFLPRAGLDIRWDASRELAERMTCRRRLNPRPHGS